MHFLLTRTFPLSKLINETIRRYSNSTSEHILSVVSRQITDIPSINFLKCGYNLRIKPNDILDPNDVNSLRASLVSSDPNTAAPGTIHIEISDKNIDIINTNVNTDPNITCVLEVPVQAELHVESESDIYVEKLYSDTISLKTSRNIQTKNVNGFKFEFESTAGDIHCSGNTLANQIHIRTRGPGNIQLDKMQGDLLFAICDSGCITTNSCYTEASKFVTLDGRLHLQNVHKFAEMYLLQGGEMEVSGFHGKLLAKLNGGSAKFQLTEVYGDSSIEVLGEEPKDLVVNVSEFVLENTALNVIAERIEMDPRLEEYRESLGDDKKTFNMENPNLQSADEDSLTVKSNGVVRLGRMSWTDSLRLKFNKSTDS